MASRYLPIALLTALALPFSVRATHLTGGSLTYTFLGDTTVSGVPAHKYEVKLVLYEDCLNGQPEAFSQDNPAFLSLYLNDEHYTPLGFDSVSYSSSEVVPLNISTHCNSNSVTAPLCLMRKIFIKRYNLPLSSYSYSISYQRCCLAASIGNVRSPGDNGITLSCSIPGTIANSSAVFKNEPQQVYCLHQVTSYDHSATDADGDSLSYEFSPALMGASDADIKPVPGPPPYDSFKYMPPFTALQPISGDIPITIDAHTGKITGLPNMVSRYLVNVCCKEWRGGVLINTTYRLFCNVVAECATTNLSFTPNIGSDTTIFAGQRIRLHSGSGLYHFWQPPTIISDSTARDPLAYFPTPGNYQVWAQVVNDSGCTGVDTITIHVIAHSEFAVPNAFSPNGDHINDVLTPMPIKGSKLITFKVFNRWGNMVYNGGPADAGWDGTYKGTLQNMDVYFWRLEYEDTFGEQHNMSGNVTLVR